MLAIEPEVHPNSETRNPKTIQMIFSILALTA